MHNLKLTSVESLFPWPGLNRSYACSLFRVFFVICGQAFKLPTGIDTGSLAGPEGPHRSYLAASTLHCFCFLPGDALFALALPVVAGVG